MTPVLNGPGLFLCVLLATASFAGCTGTGPDTSGDQSLQAPATLSTLPVLKSHTAETIRETTVPPVTPGSARSPVPASFPILPRPGTAMSSDDLFRQYLAGVMTNRSGSYSYRHVHREEVTNASRENSGGAVLADSTTSCNQEMNSINEPAADSNLMHYRETIDTDTDNSPCQSYTADVIYDRDTLLIRSGTILGSGDPDTPWHFPAGTPLANVSGFYTPDNAGALEPNLLMGTSFYLTGAEKMIYTGNETVTVPAGTFPESLHFTGQEENCYVVPCTTTTRQYWVAPGVAGFVKIRYDIDGPHLIYPLIRVHSSDETVLTARG